MNPREKEGCESILRRIDRDDLMSLKDTVTKKQITAESVNDAIRAILTYSESSLELLKRKKIKREIILKYLADNNVQISVNDEKSQLIKRALDFWGVNIGRKNRFAGGDINENSSSQTEVFTCNSTGSQSSSNDSFGHSQGTQASETPPGREIQLRHPQAPAEHPGSAVAVPTASPVSADQDHQKLGESFVSWFFRILNSNNPHMNQTPEDFGPHHFWNDVQLHLLTVAPEQQKETFEGSFLVSQRFLAFVREEHLLFNPNVSLEGVRVKSDPHGLLIIMACGTIHRANDCLGVFQQMFGLVGDPRYDNNWKVKISKLRIQSTQVTSIPKLLDSDTADLLAIIPSSNALVA